MSSLHVQQLSKWAGLSTAVALALTGCSANSDTPSPKTAEASSSSAKATEITKETASASPATASSASPSASVEPAKATWGKYKFANDNFQIDLPSNWKIEKLKADEYQTVSEMTSAFRIVSENDRDLAEVRTGYPEVMDITVRPSTQKNTVFDTDSSPAGNLVNYAFVSYNGSPNEAWMTLTSIGPSEAANWEPPLDGPVFTGGMGVFEAGIDEKTKLPDVDPSLKGASRFKAYVKTEEYKHLKRSMLSFKVLKGSSVVGESASGACVGAQYTYELADSGLSCTEAKAFFSEILEQPISTGAAELPGRGACMIPSDKAPGECIFDGTDGRLIVTKKS